jgi:hypothetical protein
MPLFEYTARNPTNGQIQKGQVDLPTKEEVTSFLRKQRMMLVSVREAPKPIKINFGAAIKTRDIVIFTRQFATMINAGLPLVQSLDILAKADGECGAQGSGEAGGVRRGGRQYAGRRVPEASEGVHRPVREHDCGR